MAGWKLQQCGVSVRPMDQPALPQENEHAATQLYPDLPCYVADEAAFQVAVQAGAASFKAGPTYSIDVIETELRDVISSQA